MFFRCLPDGCSSVAWPATLHGNLDADLPFDRLPKQFEQFGKSIGRALVQHLRAPSQGICANSHAGRRYREATAIDSFLH